VEDRTSRRFGKTAASRYSRLYLSITSCNVCSET
jgi:hypothetical protein